MKIKFNDIELNWLNAVLNKVFDYKLIGYTHVRRVAKLKNKFTPSASYCSLTGKDREFLLELVRFRKGMTATKLSDEIFLLENVERKLLNEAN